MCKISYIQNILLNKCIIKIIYLNNNNNYKLLKKQQIKNNTTSNNNNTNLFKCIVIKMYEYITNE